MKRAIFNFAVLTALTSGLLLSSSFAFAGVFDCSSKTTKGEDFSVSINFNDPKPNEPTIYKSTISLGGSDVPQLGASCFVMDRPSTRYVKCAHQSGNVRVEVYPTVETTSGALKLMQFIIWDGATPQRGQFANCTTK
jgi:hypothetical protein